MAPEKLGVGGFVVVNSTSATEPYSRVFGPGSYGSLVELDGYHIAVGTAYCIYPQPEIRSSYCSNFLYHQLGCLMALRAGEDKCQLVVQKAAKDIRLEVVGCMLSIDGLLTWCHSIERQQKVLHANPTTCLHKSVLVS